MPLEVTAPVLPFHWDGLNVRKKYVRSKYIFNNSCDPTHLPQTLHLSHINDKPRLPLCKLGRLVTKFVRWSLSRYISLDLFFHQVSWLAEIVFYFTIDISGKPFLWMNSPRFMYIDWKYYCAKNDEKLELVDKN